MITRDNYEEFFLLYIDNELSVSAREGVERFIAHHPDLQEEWQALLQCRLPAEQPIVFPDREALYRTEILKEAEEEDLPHFSPDLSIVFPGKDTLYKQEEDRRIILLPWLRVAAAAAIIGGIALLVMLSVRRTNAPSAIQPVAKNNKNTPAVTPAATPALYSSGGRAAIRPTTGKRPEEKKKMTTGVQDGHEEKEPVNKDLAQQTEPRDPVQTRLTDITATRAADIATTKEAVTPVSAGVQDVVAAVQTDIPRDQSSFATQALQQENNDPESDILVSDEQTTPGKGKLRGLFRKVTRTFGKTADRDKDGQREVLIGAFQFALK